MSNVVSTGRGKIDPRILEKSYIEATELTVSVAEYLRRRDGLGNNDSSRMLAARARESLRLSSCLMQVMAWFMVQKGILNGEIKPEDGGSTQYRLEGQEVCLRSLAEGAEELPEEFHRYLAQAMDIYRRADRMDRMLYEGGDEAPKNPVHEMLDKLKNEKTP